MSAEPLIELDPDELRPGTSLLGGRLIIKHRIGRGGMSTVYAATDHGRTVAVKFIASAVASDPNVRQRFRNEARLAQALADHPRVVTPYELGEAPELGGRLFITMPLIKGTPLSMMADRHAWERWVAVAADLARTLAELHERGIIHRDIKPGNVILSAHDGEDVPYLLDFGSAYCTGDGHVPSTSGLTRADECPGTKFYMAPEQALGHPAAPSFDIYALALSLYELLAGAHPLQGMTPAEAVRRKCNRELPSLSLRERRPDLPDAVLDAVDQALKRDPEHRTPTASVLAENLEAALRPARGAVPLGVADAGDDAPAVVEPPRPSGVEADGVDELEPVSQADGPGATLAFRAPIASADPGSRRYTMLWLGLVATAVLVAVALAMWPEAPQTSSTQQRAVIPSAAAVSDEGVTETTYEGPETDDGTGEPGVVPAVGSESGGSTVHEEVSSSTGHEEPVVVPEEAAPVVRERRRDRRNARSRAPDPSSPECVTVRQAAEHAVTNRDWSAVLRATAPRGCWANRVPWRSMRTQAFHALGKYRACVKAAKGATDTSTRRTAHLCQAELSNENPDTP